MEDDLVEYRTREARSVAQCTNHSAHSMRFSYCYLILLAVSCSSSVISINSGDVALTAISSNSSKQQSVTLPSAVSVKIIAKIFLFICTRLNKQNRLSPCLFSILSTTNDKKQIHKFKSEINWCHIIKIK